MSIPDNIKKHKPNQFGALEIRCFGEDKYYVYQITSRWNAEKNRPQKVTGKSIGKITAADGFIPNANGLRLMKEIYRCRKTTLDQCVLVPRTTIYSVIYLL